MTNHAELARIKTDPQLSRELHSYTDFATYYLTMDTYNPPFDNLKVRQAFSHAIDRGRRVRIRAPGFRDPRLLHAAAWFPGGSDGTLKPVQRYDPALGRKLLAEAGYPDGKGFPRVEMWVRRDVRPVHEAGEAIHAMIKQNLGIDLVVRNMEVKIFMDAINSHQLPLGLVRFGADFIDPSSLMNLWLLRDATPGNTTFSTAWWSRREVSSETTRREWTSTGRPNASWWRKWAASSCGTRR